MKLKPCKKCGSTNITLWDCGYSSFNPGGGKCDKGHKVSGEAGCSPTTEVLASIWNKGQELTSEEKLIEENRRLKEKILILKRRHKIILKKKIKAIKKADNSTHEIRPY